MAGEKILVVEDEGVVMLNIKKTLEKLGYCVVGMAASGEAAIGQATELRPDLVLMDIILNGSVDGIDAAEKIRALFHIPIIYLTAHTDEATLQRAKLTGPHGYIVKPFRERDLAISIEFALYKARIEAEQDALVRRLEMALEKVKLLEGLIPICAYCKKIRDANGSWQRIENYIAAHTEARLSHGICPECAQGITREIEGSKG